MKVESIDKLLQLSKQLSLTDPVSAQQIMEVVFSESVSLSQKETSEKIASFLDGSLDQVDLLNEISGKIFDHSQPDHGY
jgi:hypothetical protein